MYFPWLLCTTAAERSSCEGLCGPQSLDSAPFTEGAPRPAVKAAWSAESTGVGGSGLRGIPTLGTFPAQLSYPRVCQLAGEPSAQAPLASSVVELARPWGSPIPCSVQGPPWDHTHPS